MLFNSITFGVFLFVVFVVYWFIMNRPGWILRRNVFLLGVSYLFYGWWDWRFLTLIAFSSAVDYGVGLAMENSKEPKIRKRFLWLSLAVNLGLLGAFKYFGFFLESAYDLAAQFGWSGERLRLDWILPVGISFYTFQTLSYSLDVHAGRMRATRNPVAFFAYVAFFPQLVAGPIERARDLLPHFEKFHAFDPKAVRSGLFLVLWGLFKKVVVADRLALFVNQGYEHIDQLDFWSASAVLVFFYWQIYLDFSAYSDIAIGTARMLGFPLSLNFRRHMFALGFADGWRRWHISLTRWFTDYVYKPLRKKLPSHLGKGFSVLVVFGVTGFWHGANANFIVWGLFCGLLLILFEGGIQAFLKWTNHALPARVLVMIGVFVSIALSLVWFRSPDWSTAMRMFEALTAPNKDWSPVQWGLTRGEWILAWVGIGSVLLADLVLEVKSDMEQRFLEGARWKRWGLSWLLMMGITLLGSYGMNIQDEQFIYFQF